MIRLFRVKGALAASTWKVLAPSTAMLCPVPSIVTALLMVGRALAKVILPLTLKVMSLLTTQSPLVVSDPAFALLIASRRVQA
jgi:hypothetical protein